MSRNYSVDFDYPTDSIYARQKSSAFVAGLGLEPRLLVPETSVLPLDDPAMNRFVRIPYNIAFFQRSYLLPS